jgi:hypothetical protein
VAGRIESSGFAARIRACERATVKPQVSALETNKTPKNQVNNKLQNKNYKLPIS